jgi:hypothetical protein
LPFPPALVEFARQLDLARLRVVARDRLLHARLRDDHRLDVQPRHELDVVHGEDVRRVDHRQSQRRPDAREGEDRVLVGHLARDEPDDRVLDVERLQVDRRNPVLAREHGRDHVVGDQPHLDEVEAETPPVLALEFERFAELLRGQEIFADEDFAEFG